MNQRRLNGAAMRAASLLAIAINAMINSVSRRTIIDHVQLHPRQLTRSIDAVGEGSIVQ